MRRSAAKLLEETVAAAAAEAEHRRHVGAWYREVIPVDDVTTPIGLPPAAVAGWLRYPLLLSAEARARVDCREARMLGIAPGYPRPLPTLGPVIERLDPRCHDWRWSGAQELVERLVTLPTHSLLTIEERVQVVIELARYASASRVYSVS